MANYTWLTWQLLQLLLTSALYTNAQLSTVTGISTAAASATFLSEKHTVAQEATRTAKTPWPTAEIHAIGSTAAAAVANVSRGSFNTSSISEEQLLPVSVSLTTTTAAHTGDISYKHGGEKTSYTISSSSNSDSRFITHKLQARAEYSRITPVPIFTVSRSTRDDLSRPMPESWVNGLHHEERSVMEEEGEFSSAAWLALQGVHVCLATASLFVNVLAIVAAHGFAVRLTAPLQLLTSLGLAHGLAVWAVTTLYFRPSVCQRQLHAGLVLAAHDATALTLLLWAVLQAGTTLSPVKCARATRTRPVWAAVNAIWTTSLLAGHAHFILAALPSTGDAAEEDSVATGKTSSSRPYCQRAQDRSLTPMAVSLGIYATTVIVGTAACAAASRRLRTPHQVQLATTATSREPLALGPGLTLTLPTFYSYDNGRQEQQQLQQDVSAGSASAPVIDTYMSSTDVMTGVVLLAFYAVAWSPYLAAKLCQCLHPGRGKGLNRGGRDSTVGLFESENYWAVLQGTLLAPLCFCLVCPLLCGVRVSGMDVAYLRLYHACRALGRRLRPSSSATRPIERDSCTAPLHAIESTC